MMGPVINDFAPGDRRLGVHPEQGRDLAGCHQLRALAVAGAVSCHCCSPPLPGGDVLSAGHDKGAAEAV